MGIAAAKSLRWSRFQTRSIIEINAAWTGMATKGVKQAKEGRYVVNREQS